MLAPVRKVALGDTIVTLRGDVYACIEYADATGGSSLEDAFLALHPENDGEGQIITKVGDPRIFADLLYGFSASWRDESDWNATHSANAYDPAIPPRARQRYIDLLKRAPHLEFRALRNILWGLLYESVCPPGETAIANAGEARSETT